jgi:hypothetical protein
MADKTLNLGQLSEGKSKEKETYRLVNALREHAESFFSSKRFTLNTTDAVATTFWTSQEMSEGALWSVTARVQCQTTSNEGWFEARALFRRPVGGSATQTLVTAITSIVSDANLTAVLSVSGQTVIAQVQDLSGRAVSWAIWVEVRESA